MLVFSFVLCISVSAMEAEAADDTPVAVESTEIVSTNSDCNHVNYIELEANQAILQSCTYVSPTMCKFTYLVAYKCLDCGEIFTNGSTWTVYRDHVWHEHFHYVDGTYVECDYCENCGFHSRG